MKDQTDAHQLSFKHTECIENRWYMCVFFRSLCISLVSSHSQTYTLTHAYKYIDSGKHLSIKCTRAIKLFVLHAYMSVFCCLFVWFSGCYVRFVDFIRSVRSFVRSFLLRLTFLSIRKEFHTLDFNKREIHFIVCERRYEASK